VSSAVEVTGVGSASGVPDVVRLDVAVRCEAADVSSALAERLNVVVQSRRS
jgi:uncharacterized protein YggE